MTTRRADPRAACAHGDRRRCVAAFVRAGDRRRGRARPGPALSGGLFGQNQVLGSAGAPARSRPPPSRPRSRPPRPTPTRPAPRRPRRSPTTPAAPTRSATAPGATCGVNGLACFTRDAPNGFTMWLREQGHVFDWGTLKWCQAYTTPAERLLRRRDDRARRVRARRGPRPPRATTPTTRTTATPSSRPSRGRSRRRLEHARRSGAATWRPSSSSTTCTAWTAKYSTCLDLATVLTLAASSTVDRRRRLGDVDRDAQGRLDSVPTASGGNPIGGRTVTLQRRAAGHDDLGHRRRDGRRRGRRHLRARPVAGRGRRLPRGLRDPVERGHQRRHVADRQRPGVQSMRAGTRSAPGIDTPCI